MRFIIALLPLVGFACVEYDLTTENDEQGTYNPPDLQNDTQTDRIVQVTVPSVDVLWIIDNSCSMEEEQRSLTQNFDAFMAYFTDSGLDFHVGVISTDMDDNNHKGSLRTDPFYGGTYIDSSFAREDALDSFTSRAYMGVNGSATERGRDAAWSALVSKRETDNAGFYREEAGLALIVISDEDDYSVMVTIDEFASWMNNLKPDPEMVTFNSIVGPNGGCPTAAEPGRDYLAVTDQVGGIDWSICTDDWSSLLTQLGMQAAGLKREFYLSQIPVAETIKVAVTEPDGLVYDDFYEGTDWSYSRSRNSVTFSEYVPDPLAEVEISYEVLESAQDASDDEGSSDDTGE